MDCDVAREAISARIDGEREPVPSARVDEHLAGCADCADWQARATAQAQLLRALGGRGSTGPSVVADPDPTPAATGRAWPVARIGLGAVGVVQVALALTQAATGDLSAIMTGESPCGRTNLRIKGWMGRADQTTKIKGMFVRPEQVAAFVARHEEVGRARVVATRDGEMDVMTVRIETRASNPALYESTLLDTLKLRGKVELVPPGTLPNDGKVIEDLRTYE